MQQVQRDGLRIGTVALQHSGSPPVQGGALAGREPAVQRAGYQGMHQRKPGLARFDQAGGAQSVGQPGGALRLE